MVSEATEILCDYRERHQELAGGGKEKRGERQSMARPAIPDRVSACKSCLRLLGLLKRQCD